MRIRHIALFVLCAFLVGAPVSAGYKMGDKKPIKETTKTHKKNQRTQPIGFGRSPSKESADESPVVDSLSHRYNVPAEQIRYFRSLRHGYEEIVPALIIAKEAQVEAGLVLNDRMQGQTWKQISEKFDIDLSPLNKEVIEVLKPIKASLPKEAVSERPKVGAQLDE